MLIIGSFFVVLFPGNKSSLFWKQYSTIPPYHSLVLYIPMQHYSGKVYTFIQKNQVVTWPFLPVLSAARCSGSILSFVSSANEGFQREFVCSRHVGPYQAMLVLGQKGLGPHTLAVRRSGSWNRGSLSERGSPLYIWRGNQTWPVSLMGSTWKYWQKKNKLTITFFSCSTNIHNVVHKRKLHWSNSGPFDTKMGLGVYGKVVFFFLSKRCFVRM